MEAGDTLKLGPGTSGLEPVCPQQPDPCCETSEQRGERPGPHPQMEMLVFRPDGAKSSLSDSSP